MISIKNLILEAKKNDKKEISINGWVINNRGNLNVRFLNINDGSTVMNLQAVIKKEQVDLELVDKVRQGAAVRLTGKIAYTPDSKQNLELQVTEFELLKNADEDFAIQKQETSFEFLREIPHLRHRTATIKAVMLIRSTLALEIHNFFSNKDFMYFHSPILTSNDGEGAGETFIVSTEEKKFFGENIKATLGVTGQLQAESYAIGFEKVYTFGPTFRAEKSNTTKHAAEFWMLEPEVAFYELKDIISLADEMLKTVIYKTLEVRKLEFDFLEEKTQKPLRENLKRFLDNKIQTIDYKDAIIELQKVKNIFEDKDIFFGKDLATEHEKYISGNLFKGPVAVINYPKAFKAFYMHQNDDNDTVAAFDLLVPGIGELIGGSQREVRYDKLVQRMEELNIPKEDLQWYLDLRRFGDSGSSGFGLGFERLVMYVTGIENIRDSIPYPRTYKNLKM